MNIVVAARIRPFNQKETLNNSSCVVKMEGPNTIINESNGGQKKFTLDHSFWSFDGYQKEANGYLKPASGSKFADQKYIFKELGEKVVENALQGYNCCLLAYGQTGSGKSYSMFGYKQNKGIIPRVCEELLNRVKDRKNKQQIQVTVSFIEIYKQDIQDLTIDVTQRERSGLSIRQNKVLGIFIQSIKKNLIESYEQFNSLMEEALINRTLAAVQLSIMSKKVTTLVQIQLKQRKTKDGKIIQKTSIIKLGDLAGCEPLSNVKVNNISRGIDSLHQVISVLTANSNKQKKFVPYRDSSLTRLLTNALGGNCQTTILFTLSPAFECMGESLLALEFAEKVKKVKNNPIINEKQVQKLMGQLKDENDKLKSVLQQKGGLGRLNQPIKKQEEKTTGNQLNELQANFNAVKNKISEESKTTEQKRNQQQKEKEQLKQKANQSRAGQQKIVNQSQLKKLGQKSKIPPYFENISKDLTNNKKLKILLENKSISIGKADCTPPNEVIFAGRDMRAKHAILQIDEEKNVNLAPASEGCHLYLNGVKVNTKVSLKHLDRVIFGWNSVYLFKDEAHQRAQNKGMKEQQITWDFVRKEVEALVDIDESDTEDGQKCCRIF